MAWWLIVPGVPLALLAGLWLVGERGRPLGLPSTRAALKGSDGGSGRRLDLKTVHGYVYGRWSKQYIGFCIHHLLPRMGERLKGRWADRYHGKVLPTDLAKAIITLDHDIERQDLEQIIPYPIARDIVLTGPPDVVLLDCPCRLARENPCEPIQVCMIVGDGAFVLDHLPESSRRVDQAEALALLEAEHARGHVHVAYFKDACDDRFYAICNCCSCCCGGIEAMVAYGVPMVASSGYVAQVDADLCAACGECEDTCPFDAVHVEETAVVDWVGCMGCGVCVDRCTTGAMALVADGRKGIPLDVRAL
jgi:NAD-dependent dihydropyrimidine dehydrogenase PreA subunit